VITVYTKPNCQPCRATKRWLDNRSVDYQTVDVTTSPADLAAIKSLGYEGVPVVIVSNGDAETDLHLAWIPPGQPRQVHAAGCGGMKIYIAGPMSGLPEFNYPAFHAADAELRALGHETLNPANNPECDSWEGYMRAAIAQVSPGRRHRLPARRAPEPRRTVGAGHRELAGAGRAADLWVGERCRLAPAPGRAAGRHSRAGGRVSAPATGATGSRPHGQRAGLTARIAIRPAGKPSPMS